MKIDNHTVTRGYLEGWQSEDESGAKGIWYFDLTTRNIIFSKGKKARFAISEAIFAPKHIGNDHDDRLENWFAESETEMCDLARYYSGHPKRPRKLKPRTIEKGLCGFISFSARSKSSIDKMHEIFAQNNPDMEEDDVKIAVLNNVYNVVHENIRFFRRGTLLILRKIESPLFTNDAPFWDMTPRSQDYPIAVCPLSPSSLMVLLPDQTSIAGGLQIKVENGKDHEVVIEFARKAAMRMARQWVVCPSYAAAKEVESYLTEETMREAASTDRVLQLGLSDVARKLFV